jgi:hypothetical protein
MYNSIPNIVSKSNIKNKGQGQIIAEVYLLPENGDTVLAVEVKTDLTIADAGDHVGRMEKLRRYTDEHGDRRKPAGMAARRWPRDTVRISVPEGFKPGNGRPEIRQPVARFFLKSVKIRLPLNRLPPPRPI